MPERTKEELKAIYKDLVRFQDLLDNELAGYYMCLKDYSNEKEKNKILDLQIEKINDYIDNGAITTCEGVSLCHLAIEENEKNKEYPFVLFVGGFFTFPSSTNTLLMPKVNNTIKGFIKLLKNEIEEKNPDSKSDKLKNGLDWLGWKENCIPIAYNEKLKEEARSLAFDPENVSIDKEIFTNRSSKKSIKIF